MCDDFLFPELNCPDYASWMCPNADQPAVTDGDDALAEWEGIGAQTWYPATYPSTAGAFIVEYDRANGRIKWDGSWVNVTEDTGKAEISDGAGQKWKIEKSDTHGGFLAGSTCCVKYTDGTIVAARTLG